MWIPVCELEGERWEDGLEVAPIFKIPRAEETCPEFSIRKAHLGKCLGNR